MKFNDGTFEHNGRVFGILRNAKGIGCERDFDDSLTLHWLKRNVIRSFLKGSYGILCCKNYKIFQILRVHDAIKEYRSRGVYMKVMEFMHATKTYR